MSGLHLGIFGQPGASRKKKQGPNKGLKMIKDRQSIPSGEVCLGKLEEQSPSQILGVVGQNWLRD
jgi:hypothetical protein